MYAFPASTEDKIFPKISIDVDEYQKSELC
jgi:hypothetical protein